MSIWFSLPFWTTVVVNRQSHVALLVASHLLYVVLHVSVASVHGTHVHGTNIVRVAQSLTQSQG